jgi:hypothetical protein
MKGQPFRRLTQYLALLEFFNKQLAADPLGTIGLKAPQFQDRKGKGKGKTNRRVSPYNHMGLVRQSRKVRNVRKRAGA